MCRHPNTTPLSTSRFLGSLLLSLPAVLAFGCSSDQAAPATTTGESVDVEPATPPVEPVEAEPELSGYLLTGRTNADTYDLRVGVEPWPIPLNEPFTLDVHVVDAAGEPLSSELELDVQGWMPDHEHGMSRRPLVERTATGRYSVQGMLFHMPGLWELRLDLSADGLSERGEFELELD